MRLLRCLKSVQPNKKSNERDFVAFEKKSAFIVVIWRSCNLSHLLLVWDIFL